MMDAMVTLLPLLTILALVVLVLWAAHWWLLGRHRELPGTFIASGRRRRD